MNNLCILILCRFVIVTRLNTLIITINNVDDDDKKIVFEFEYAFTNILRYTLRFYIQTFKGEIKFSITMYI